MTFIEKMVIALIVSIVLIAPATTLFVAYGTDTTVTFTVKDKERVTIGNGGTISSKYLIYTDKEVYENTDSVWYWKWDSADLYSQLEPGKTYTARVYGFRVPFLSWFRNIISVDESHV